VTEACSATHTFAKYLHLDDFTPLSPKHCPSTLLINALTPLCIYHARSKIFYAVRGDIYSHHTPEEDISALTVVVGVLLWTRVSQSPEQFVVVSLWRYFTVVVGRATGLWREVVSSLKRGAGAHTFVSLSPSRSEKACRDAISHRLASFIGIVE